MTVSLESTLVSWKVRTMPSRATLYGGDTVQRLAVERPGARVGLVEAGEQVEEGGLAGAVGADQRGDGAALDLDVVDVDGGEAAEPADDAVGDQDRVGLGGARLAWRRRRGRPSAACLASWSSVASQRRQAGQRASSAISFRSPKIPCGRKIISSIRPSPTRMNRTCAAWRRQSRKVM